MWESYYITRNSDDLKKNCIALENSDIKSRYYWYDVACTFLGALEMPEKACRNFEKIEKINTEWGEEWHFSKFYTNYSRACHESGNHKKEAELFSEGLKLFPENPTFIYLKANCAVARKDTAESKVKLDLLLKKGLAVGYSMSGYEFTLKEMYLGANEPEKAEEHFRKALALKPGSDRLKAGLARFLIQNGKVDEGMKLVDEALKSLPQAPDGLWTKAMGYYAQGKIRESWDLLSKARENYPLVCLQLDKDTRKVQEALNNLK